MTVWLPAIVAVLYLLTSVEFTFEGRWGWALVYFSYALANVGLIFASVE